MAKLFLLISPLFFIFCTLETHSKPLILNDSKMEYLIENAVVYIDSGSTKTFNEVKPLLDSSDNSINIYTVTIQPHTSYWLKVEVKNDNSSDVRWILEQLDLHTGEMNVWYRDHHDKLNFVKNEGGGYYLPFSEKKFNYKNFLFELTFDSTNRATIYIQATSGKTPFTFIFKIKSTQQFIQYSLKEYILLGIFYGFILLVFIYSFYLYIAIRDLVYLYYGIYIICGAFLFLKNDGIGFQYLWPDYPDFNYLTNRYGHYLFLSSYCFFSVSFLELKHRLRFWKLIIFSLLVIYLLADFFAFPIFSNTINNYLYISIFILIGVSAIHSLYLKNFSSLFFLIGMFLLFLGFLFFHLMIWGIIPGSILAVYSFNIGFVLEILAFIAAISYKFHLIKIDNFHKQELLILELKRNEELKESINRELEIKVDERTNDLKIAYEEINRINNLLKEDNQLLSEDVKRVRKERILKNEVSFEEFQKTYPDENSCFELLVQVKWGKGYQCKKCKGATFTSGKLPYSRRCTKCGYTESAMSDTIFHSLKFSLLKAFYMVFLIYTKNTKAEELSRLTGLSLNTTSAFKRKTLQHIQELPKKDRNQNWQDILLVTKK